ncbi:MAG: hypothetical protein JSV85_05355 [Candidatus Bathyarchaeota archaeon]|nr:MAG: hypothetical protein JSV85_05355 [Candidatus Bathyarchaeota archaeon]
MPRKKKSEEETENLSTYPESIIEETTTFPKPKPQNRIENLQTALKNIKAKDGVIGYILRASKSASIDLKDPTRIIDYAMLSSTILEAGETLSNTFELGKIHKVMLEGKDAKILSLKIDDSRLSIFMEKTANQDKIYKNLNLA